MDALVWGLSELTDDREQEIFYEYPIPAITPELDEIDDLLSRF